MKYLFTFLIIVFVCSSCDSKKKQLETLPDHSWVKFDLANCYLQLPNYLKVKSLDEIRDIIKINSSNTSDTVRINREIFEMLEESNKKYQVLLDSRNNTNLLFAIDNEYIKFSKELSGFLLGKFEEQLINNWVMQGKLYEKIDARYFQGARAQLIKIKFRLVSHNYQSYYTQYIISNKLKTFQIIVMGTESEDYEKAILGMRI